jgi:hypothetical protein
MVINEKLLKAAIHAIDAKTKREAIETGLASLMRPANRESLRKELGTYDLDLSLEKLESTPWD